MEPGIMTMLAGKGIDLVSNWITGNAQANAYDKYRKKMQKLAQGTEEQFLQATGEKNPLQEGMMKDIQQQAARAQQQAAGQSAANLARSGVRGGQAATLMNRATGDVAQQFGQEQRQLAYQDYLRRQQAREQYYGNKAGGVYSQMLAAQQPT